MKQLRQCVQCGVRGGCGCLFTQTANGLICGLCSGRATLEKAAEIRHLQKQQGIKAMQENVVINPKKVRANAVNY